MTDDIGIEIGEVLGVPASSVPALSSVPVPLSRDIIKEIAMDIGKEVAHHIEIMYPDAVRAASSTFLLSVRNSTYNNIMAALETTDETEIRATLEANKIHRRKIKATYKKIRETDGEAVRKANRKTQDV